jgi:hypothetical protein
VTSLLTLIAYLVAAGLAIGYVCETGLPSWRRATACVLSMIVVVAAGHLLTSSHPVLAYAAGIPSLLALGAIMMAPERKAKPRTSPNRRASDRAQPATTVVSWQFDRRAPRRRAPRPILTDRRGAHHNEFAAEISNLAQAIQITRAPAATRIPGGAAGSPQWSTDGHLAARRRHGRGHPRSLSRMSRCRYR